MTGKRLMVRHGVCGVAFGNATRLRRFTALAALRGKTRSALLRDLVDEALRAQDGGIDLAAGARPIKS